MCLLIAEAGFCLRCISKIIDGQSVPAGSWLATTKISNDELIKSILEGKLTGYSLGSVPSEAYTEKYWFVNKSRKYSDFEDIENLQPMFISFVDKGANGYTFEVMDYEVYINKNDKSEDKIMSEQKIETNEDMISMSALERIGKIFGFSVNKNADTVVEVEPPIEPIQNEPAIDMDALKNDIQEAVTIGIAEGIKQATAVTEEPPVEPKDDEPVENEASTVEDVKVNKRATKKEEEVEVPQTSTNFYKMSGRDNFGCKIRK